jgi:hypothetical protein
MTTEIPLESLPDGTSLKTPVFWYGIPFTHYGIVQRAWDGTVLIHHNSKRIGRAATTDINQFRDGNSPVEIDSIPSTLSEGWERAERARADVEKGIRWTVDNNCEDMRSRAITGRGGSPTRNLIGLGVIGLLFIAIGTSGN